MTGYRSIYKGFKHAYFISRVNLHWIWLSPHKRWTW